MTPSAAPATDPDTDTLNRARRRYAPALSHIELASRAAEAPLTPDQIWNLLARSVSPQWVDAYSRLQAAQQKFNHLYSNENKPLGAIGAALESDHSVETEEEYLQAQSRFTVVDERLRGKKFLSMLMEDLVARQKSLEVSMGLTSSALRITLDLPEFVAAAKPAKPALPLRDSFGNWARKIVSAVARKPAVSTGAPRV